MMLYKLLKFLFYFTVNGYFRSIYIKGDENIPQKGPVIFAANHNSAFMDPILLAVRIPRRIYFLARGDVFNNKFAAAIFKMLNMIPVYRADHDPNDMHKNAQVFEKCFQHLAKGRTIMIFPEGTSKTERKLRPIKTGVARICLGAEKENNFNLDVKIVPIGINYSNPHNFKSDVFVNFGAPISVKEYQKQFEANEREGVAELTERLKTELEKLVLIVEDERLEKLIKQIEILYRSKLRDESRPTEKAPQDFYLSKEIIKAVEFFAQNRPDELNDFEDKIDSYLTNLRRLHIRDTHVRSSRLALDYFWLPLFFVFTFPIFLYGFLTNYLAYKVPGLLTSRLKMAEDFVGSVKITAGMFVFLIVYLAETYFVSSATNIFIGIAFFISLYPAGMFTMYYIKTFYKTRGTFRYIRTFIRKSDLVAEMKVRRKELVDLLENARELYVNQVKK